MFDARTMRLKFMVDKVAMEQISLISIMPFLEDNRAKPRNVQKTCLFRISRSIGQNGTFEVFERSQSCGTLSRMLKACLNIKIHNFNNCNSMSMATSVTIPGCDNA